MPVKFNGKTLSHPPYECLYCEKLRRYRCKCRDKEEPDVLEEALPKDEIPCINFLSPDNHYTEAPFDEISVSLIKPETFMGSLPAAKEFAAILDIIVAEWNSDPMSMQCFDLRVVQRAKDVLDKWSKTVKAYPEINL